MRKKVSKTCKLDLVRSLEEKDRKINILEFKIERLEK